MKLKAQNLKKLMAKVMTLVMLVALLPNVLVQNVQAVEKQDAGEVEFLGLAHKGYFSPQSSFLFQMGFIQERRTS